MAQPPDFNPDDLPEWMRSALSRALNQPADPTVMDHRNGVAWPMLVEAALVGSFLPRDLDPDLPAGEERVEAENAVIRFAETSYGPAGLQWTLTPQSRSQIVEAAIGTDVMRQAVERTRSKFTDGVSSALRTCVFERNLDFSTVDLASLEACRTAVTSLVGVSQDKLELPPLDKLDREIALRRLLHKFERMVGRKTDANSDTTDRFFGREAELQRLRDYVGVLPPTSRVVRALEQLVRKIIERGPLTVWGIGGSGKTTLISKFMLEHAEAASSRFPFAYLDFDRTTIGARQRLDLLAEMCAQVGAQFEQLTAPMTSLQTDVLKLARDLEAKNQPETISELSTYCMKFRELIDGLLSSLESRSEWARPFLLVFDTFEVVQYEQGDIELDAVVMLEEFVRCFSRSDENATWHRLRLIISGRKRVAKFMGTVEECMVGALDPIGSAQLLIELARDANKPITESEAAKLVEVVAKAVKETNNGIQPLRLHLIGEVFSKSKGGGKVIVEWLIDELSKPLEKDGLAAQILIDGILVRRILDHVTDKRVKALADPGLVVRRITPEVIQKVMTVGTSKPSDKDTSTEVVDYDADVTDPWIVDDNEAESIFKSFSREVTLVEADGNALRHRADVRQQMLPLIRARRRKRFKSLNQLAFDYFAGKAREDEKDLSSAGEAIYHGLWLEQPLAELDQFWRTAPGFSPRLDPDDFDAGSIANIYVRAKSHFPLTATEVEQLPCGVALEWLDARSADLLGDYRVEDAIQTIRVAIRNDYSNLDGRTSTAAVLCRLLYRAGFWQEAVDLAMRHLKAAPEPSPNQTTFADESLISLVRTLATVAGKSSVSTEVLEKLSNKVGLIGEALVRAEVAAHVIVGFAQHGEEWRSRGKELKQSVLLPAVRAIDNDIWRGDKKVLRVVILCDEDCVVPELIPMWISATERVPRDVDATLIDFLLNQIFRGTPAALEVDEIIATLKSQKSRRDAMNRLDEFWRHQKNTILFAVINRPDLKPVMRRIIAADNSDWVRPFGNSLTRALRDESGPALFTTLGKEGFRVRSGRRDLSQETDGIALVQYAMDDGQLLNLAASVSDWARRNGKLAMFVPTTYPQDAFAISSALTRWHESLNWGEQSSSWEDAPQLESFLNRALNSFDWQAAEVLCREIGDRIRRSRDLIPEATARRLLSSLRRKRRFELMRQLAEACTKSGLQSLQLYRQHAQALIDLGRLDEAESVLVSLISRASGVVGEVAEARGLLARVYKQRYFDSHSIENLKRALDLYYDVYRLNPEQNMWHGINIVALAARARRDGVSLPDIPDDVAIAHEILSNIDRRESLATTELFPFDEATRLEALIAVGRFSDADASAMRLVDSVGVDAFELGSVIRQLEQVWQLNYSEAPGNHVLPILKAAHLSKEGGFSERDFSEVAAEATAVGLALDELEEKFGPTRTVTLKWYKQGLEQCNSVARIEKLNGTPHGTGWLVQASDFFPGREGVLLLTNEHVISADPKNSIAIHPDDAQVNFQVLNEVFRVKEIVWSSPSNDLDATFIVLDGEPKAPPLVLHTRAVEMPPPPSPAPRLYIIGHPQGREIEFSIEDNHLIASNEVKLHYRTPTERGSSGSPVFESDYWRVVALHHGGSPALPRLDGTPGTYEANEGISLLALKSRLTPS